VVYAAAETTDTLLIFLLYPFLLCCGKKPLPEAKFLDIIRTKVIRVFLLAVDSQLY
jgi:hypothetical protein